MNKENVQRLIDYLRKQPDERFDMHSFVDPHEKNVPHDVRYVINDPEFYRHHCGTTACMAGHIVIGFAEELRPHFDPNERLGYVGVGMTFLGIDYENASELFLENLLASRDEAIAVLEKLRDTGLVLWY